MVTGPRTALAALYTLGTTPGGCQALARVSSLPAALAPQLAVADEQLATMAAATLGASSSPLPCVYTHNSRVGGAGMGLSAVLGARGEPVPRQLSFSDSRIFYRLGDRMIAGQS